MLKLSDISKIYTLGAQRLTVLKGIDLEVQAGDFLAIMGKSGSGKSTLMNIMGLLDKASSGIYELEGKNVKQYNDDQISRIRNRKIGFVFQSFNLLPRLSALDNVAYPLIYRELSEKEMHQRALEMLEKMDMADRAKHKPNELSGGQQQRVAIARALVGKPRLILADEPTGALDSKVSKEIMDLLTTLNRDENLTIVVITHDASVAKRCQRNIFMNDGLLEELH